MNKSRIAPTVLQEVFDSAKNAAVKGQAQWFTPDSWARLLTLPLPRYRPFVTDLNCGNGALLKAATRSFTEPLGCDIEPQAGTKYVAADVTKLYPLLCAVNWKCDLFVLNPPWDLHWHRERLKALSDSDCPAVREAFAARDGRAGQGQMDSTSAMLCIALDRCSDYGEGFVIANEATLQRLIFAKDAPHRALAIHVWAHLTVRGNLCEPKSKSDFVTGVIYFARPLQSKCYQAHCPTFETAQRALEELRRNRVMYRRGAEPTGDVHTRDSGLLWEAATDESLRTTGMNVGHPPYNIWLDATAMPPIIRTYLSLFDQHTGRVPEADAHALFALNGKQPLQLVMQRQHRKALEAAVTGSLWKVDLALRSAVQAAIAEYNAIRAPLYPLSKIQRLGYLDEQDEIKCIKNLKGAFTQGQSYALRSTTLAVRRDGTKMNLAGGLDAVEWNAQELAFFITDNAGVERCFMEARLRDPNIEINLLVPGGKPGRQRDLAGKCAIDFTMQELAGHFHIPDVPDVATLNPQVYQRHLAALDEIAALCN